MTSTDVAPRAESAPATPVEPSALMRWAADAREAHIIAQALAKTSFVPASLRNKPEDITAAILAGQELGLQPMSTLRSIDVIQGTPALRAHAMRALVQSHGHEIEVVESTDEVCRVRGRRGRLIGAGGEWQEVVWDIPRARKLGLVDKDQWKKQPRTMLVARATSEMCRLIAADALYAMPYAAEELDEEQPSVKAAARVTSAELLAKVPALTAEPEAPTEPTTEPVVEEWPDVAQPPGVAEGAA